MQTKQENHLSICVTKKLTLDLLVNCRREFLLEAVNLILKFGYKRLRSTEAQTVSLCYHKVRTATKTSLLSRWRVMQGRKEEADCVFVDILFGVGEQQL